ncbi:hypothetical protein PHYBOEH_009966 [Phytophthora boehmeriae]|uniref:Uncharacterized protein n=1 Tax=Phytophthora boehmeriae TaxID=109152 RepID=A0A8T1X4J5_9STRA|nr:hypothetical protein PHYBOEH_009966 [Phytophthora boehmeriae]
MWTVLFGDDEASDQQPPQVKTQPAPSPQLSTPPVTPSPLDDPRPSTPPPQKSQPPRANAPAESVAINAKETDDTPMAMLLKRLNNLMIKVGEHEFEKKTLVDQMEKERKLLTAKIGTLEQQIEDLQDQNVQLQYKVEYTSEPMLMERVQDITDMRDALDGVKKQLEAELQLKEKELVDLKIGLQAKDKELGGLRQEYEQQIADLSAECEAAKQEAADAAKIAEDAVAVKYEEQLQEKEDALQIVTALKETLETSLAEKEQALGAAETTLAQVQTTLAEVQANGETDLRNLQQQLEEATRVHEQLQQQLGESTRGSEQLLQQQLEEVAKAHERELQSVRDENQLKLEALEAHAQEQEALAAEKSQELEDYKHDCVELWKINEDLKQQIALTSAETMLKQAELRENALSGQSVLQEKVTDLENQLEALHEQLNSKMQEIAELKAEAESHVSVGGDDEASGEDEDKFVVVENGGGGAIRILTDQVATAQRELTEAMELNLHLNNRNAWLEEQYQMLSSVQSDGDDDQDESGATKVSLEEQVAALEHELQEARRAANEQMQHVTNLEHNHNALSTEFDRLRVVHKEMTEAKETNDAVLNDLRRELETIRASEANASSDMNQKLFAKEQELAELPAAESSSIDLQRSNDGLSQLLEQTRSKASQLEQQVSAMRAEHGDAHKQVEVLTKKNLSLVAEVQSIREEADKQKQSARVQLEQLTVAQSSLERELAEVKPALLSKDAEIAAVKQRSQTDVAQLEDLVNRYKADKQSSDQRLAQLNVECEHLRQSHGEAKIVAERSQQELDQVRVQVDKIQQANATLEAEVNQLRGANDDEKGRLLQEVDEKQRVNQRLEETNRELEGLLNKSKAYCEELSRESEDKISRMQEFASHVEQEARDEIDRIVHENGVLRDELEQLAQVRYEETTAHDELRVKLAELQAENNVLSARAHRLTQQLSQYTDLPEDDEMAAAGQGQTPDLWELLSSGMEQLKADLELASKYAASIDASSVDGRTEAGGDESFTVAN